MNKDVIYIEPEDDITDIILKIENAKEKIVALVPPKKAGVFRSVVNIKLITKAGATSEKTIVLVTVDPSIVKLAAAAKIPVAKNLQSAPVIPAVEAASETSTTDKEELVEESDGTVETEEDVEASTPAKEEKPEDEEEKEEPTAEEEPEEPKKPKSEKKKSAKTGNKILDWIKQHKKLSIFAGISAIAIIVLVIWMLFIAPAVDITVAIKTDQRNFSENVTFTDSLEKEDAEEGKFYLEEKKIETQQQIEFEATGKKNLGNKAKGEVVISAIFDASGAVSVNPGTVFTINGLSYASDEYKALEWDGEEDACENEKKISGGKIQCLISETVKVTATEGGSKYNINASSTGWSTVANINVYSTGSMSGGTDKEITVVQQSDIIKAQNELATAKEEELKEKLYDTIDDNYYVIETSFKQTASNVVATPAADEEVGDGVKPSIKTTTTATVYVIDKVKLEQFIKKKAELDDDQKIYEVKDIYIENMSEISTSSTSKLKAQYYVGPKITESEVVDKIKGRGLGDAQREIRDIYGVSDVKINTSYPWVMSVPGDSNKVSVRFEIKDQDSNDVQEKAEDSEEGESDDEKEDKKDSDKK